jgi:ketosteroid isomerase-like protein
MPSPNVGVVRRGVAAWERRDDEALLKEFAEEIEVVDPERAGAGPFVGHAAYLRWMAEWYESWEHYHAHVEALVEVGDQVVVFQRHVGRAKGSGIELDHRGALLARVKDGKIVLYRPYTHRAEALEDAGLTDGESWRIATETILAGYDAWNRGDVEAVIKLMEPDSEFVPIQQSIMPAFTGPEGMREFFESSAEVWEEFRFDPVVFVPIGDEMLVELDAKGTAKGSGIHLEEHWAHVYTQHEGRLVRFRAFGALDEALAALS